MDRKILGTREMMLLAAPLIGGLVLFFAGQNLIPAFVEKPAVRKTPDPVPVSITELPAPDYLDRELFESAIRVRPYSQPVTSKIQTPHQKEPPPAYRISFIYIGNGSYAIINGRLYKEGDRISPDEKIIKISPDGVLLRGKWGDRWIKFSE
ncbi:hypothetical protein [Persephonella sp.]